MNMKKNLLKAQKYGVSPKMRQKRNELIQIGIKRSNYCSHLINENLVTFILIYQYKRSFI